MNNIRVAVIQDGARLHYAAPLAFKQAGMLAGIYTDWYNRQSWLTEVSIKIARRVSPHNAQRMQQRRSEELAGVPIYDHPILFHASCLRRKPGALRRMASDGAVRLIRRIDRRRGPIAPRQIDLVYGFSNCMNPSGARWIRHLGIPLVLDQPIATAVEMNTRLAQTLQRWPGWETTAPLDEQQIHGDQEIQMLSIADHLTCASEYVKKSLLELKIDPDHISVIPYPLDATPFPFINRGGRSGPVTVGIIGTVSLRKGAPVVLEVAKKFPSDQVRFLWIGISTLAPERQREMRDHVNLTGPVLRSQIPEQLGKFDIFMLASRAEGSPSALMEAMASGLPVVTTTNSGTVARDGVEGYIREIDDIDGMAAAIEKLASDGELRLSMGRAARERILNFNIEWYSRSLADVAARVVKMRCG
jgi:glycosyltransferase involved in cell wall biosynthesis